MKAKPTPTERKCNMCLKVLPIDRFRKRTDVWDTKTHYEYTCKECVKKHRRKK